MQKCGVCFHEDFIILLFTTFGFSYLCSKPLEVNEKKEIDYQKMRENLRNLDLRLDSLLNSIDSDDSKKSIDEDENSEDNSIIKKTFSESFIPLNFQNQNGWDLFVLRELALKHSPELLIKKLNRMKLKKKFLLQNLAIIQPQMQKFHTMITLKFLNLKHILNLNLIKHFLME